MAAFLTIVAAAWFSSSRCVGVCRASAKVFRLVCGSGITVPLIRRHGSFACAPQARHMTSRAAVFKFMPKVYAERVPFKNPAISDFSSRPKMNAGLRNALFEASLLQMLP